jgi:hypothetical protein
MPFNLLTEAWIPVLWIDGQPGRVGIRDALTRAGMIRQIAASNPMDNVALPPLFAGRAYVVQGGREVSWRRWTTGAPQPENWLAKLEENKPAFQSVGDGKRFYQDELLKGKECRGRSPICLVEFPGTDS